VTALTWSRVALIAAISTLAGMLWVWWSASHLRPPTAVEDGVIGWLEAPLRPVLRDPFGRSVLLLQALEMLAIGGFLAPTISEPFVWPFPEMNADPQTQLLDIFIRAGSLAVVFVLFGSLLGTLVRSFRKDSARVVVLPDGVLYGSTFFDWDSFSHFRTDRALTRVDIYSRVSPGLRSLGLRPPSRQVFEKTVGYLDQHLPQGVQNMPIAWQRTGVGLISALVGLGAAFLSASCWAGGFAAPWAWFLHALLAASLYILNIRVVARLFSFKLTHRRGP
jgi:hypothetical protein